MEMYVTTGARDFPRVGPLGVHGGTWSALSVPSGTRRLRAGIPFCALLHPTGIDLPVTDRMRLSASEP
jgi:hypothetical protein